MGNWIISKKVLLGFGAVAAALMLATPRAFAEVEQPSQITIQGTGLFTRSSSNGITSHDATESGGVLVGYSYQLKPRFGIEANYGYARNTQSYSTAGGQTAVDTNVHEAMAGLILRIPVSVPRVRPYVLGRSGVLIFDPIDKSATSGPQRQTRMAFVYGGGADFNLTSNFGVRAEYRGLIYKTPDFSVESLNLDKFTHLAQPSVGFFFRF